MASPIGKTIEETNGGEQEECLAFELHDGPKGLSSLRKLMKGFCGGGFFGAGSSVELPPDSLHNGSTAVQPKVDTNIDNVPNLKMENNNSMSPSLGDNVCNDTLATTDSSLASVSEEKPASGGAEVKNIEVEDQGDAIEMQVVTEEEKKGAQEEEVVKRELDDTDQGGEATTNAETEEEVIVPESTTKNGSSSFGMLIILCFVLVAVATKVLFPGFREQGLEKLGLYVQRAVETELVQSTQKLAKLEIDEIVKEVIEETQSNDKKKTKTVKKNKSSPMKESQEAPEKEQEESRPKAEDSQSKSKILASLEEAMEKENDSIQALAQVGNVVAANLVEQKEEEDAIVNPKEKIGNPSEAENQKEANAKTNESKGMNIDDDDIAKDGHANTFQRPAFVRPPSKEKERVSEAQDEL